MNSLGICRILLAFSVIVVGNCYGGEEIKKDTKTVLQYAPKKTTNILLPRKKVISLDWCSVPAAYLKEHLADIEKSVPLDGTMLRLTGKDDKGKVIDCFQTWTPDIELKKEWFKEDIDTLKACKFTKFGDNFFWVTMNPGNLDLFDDAGWAKTIRNQKLYAAIAKETRLKGICLDPEDYSKLKLFSYCPEKGHSFEEASAMMRKRGAEFMKAVSEEYPDITILGLWMTSIVSSAWQADDIVSALKKHHYGLYPAFVDGMLDTIPPGAKLVDGTENAYEYGSEYDFLKAYHEIRTKGMALISPENRHKYLTQISVGFAVYLDMYINKNSRWYMAPKTGGTQLDRFQDNLSYALDVSDEYVWVYGETAKWWPVPYPTDWFTQAATKGAGKGRLWEEALPGVTERISIAKNPTQSLQAAINRIEKSGTPKNLSVNPGCDEGASSTPARKATDWVSSNLPPGYLFWKTDTSKGTVLCDRTFGCMNANSLKASNVTDTGCFLQKVPVVPGGSYAVIARCFNKGKGNVFMTVRWQNQNNEWLREDLDVPIAVKGSDNAWGQAMAECKVPPDCTYMVVLLGMEQQKTPDDMCWWDDLRVYPLDNVAAKP